MTEPKKLELQMRSGEIDCNNQELFFSALIKGLMSKLDDGISIRSLHTSAPWLCCDYSAHLRKSPRHYSRPREDIAHKPQPYAPYCHHR